MGAGTGAGTGTRTERRVGRKESPGTYEMIAETVWKTREEGRRQRVTSSHSRKTQRPSETVASCGEPEPRDKRRRAGPGRAEEVQKITRNPIRALDAIWKTWETWAVREKHAVTSVLVQ